MSPREPRSVSAEPELLGKLRRRKEQSRDEYTCFTQNDDDDGFVFRTMFWGEGIISGVEAQHRDSHLGQFVTRTGVLIIIIARLVAEQHRREALIKLPDGTSLDTECFNNLYSARFSNLIGQNFSNSSTGMCNCCYGEVFCKEMLGRSLQHQRFV